jgi:nickel and cobalt resistance protein CnrR
MTPAAKRSLVITLALALLAGIVGAVIGTQFTSSSRTNADNGLHGLLHDNLDLTEAQDRGIAAEEALFRGRRKALEQRVKNANAELARAIRTTKRDGPEVQSAIDRVHDALGDYQKETVAHIFRMRSVLTPAQAEKFDRAIADALTKDDR